MHTQPSWIFGKHPCVFVGIPERCVGFLALRNTSDAPLRLRRLPLRVSPAGASVRRADQAEAAEHEGLCIEARIFDTLPPHQEREVQTELALDPATPPGLYHAALQGVDGTTHPASIHVLEHHELELSPSLIEHSVPEPGASVRVSFLARNLGNVPLVVPQRVVVHFQPEHDVSHYFHRAVRTRGKQGYEPVLDELAARMGEGEESPGRGRVTSGAGSLAPKEARLVTLELVAPRELAPGRTHRAQIVLATAKLRLVFHTSARTQARASRAD